MLIGTKLVAEKENRQHLDDDSDDDGEEEEKEEEYDDGVTMHILCAEHHAKCFPYIPAESSLPMLCYLHNPITFVHTSKPTEWSSRLKPPSALAL